MSERPGQQGPQGAQQPQGAQGVQGPQGTRQAQGARTRQEALGLDDDSSPFAWSDGAEPGRGLADLLFSLGAIAAATVVGLAFDAFGMGTCIVIAYVVAVQVTALVTLRRVHCLMGSALAVAAYNYFFTSPRHSLTAWGAAYPGTFAVMFATALISSYVAMALRREAHRSREAQRRTTIMLETNRLLQDCATRQEVLDTAGAQLARMAHRACVWYEAQEDGGMAAMGAYLPSGEKGLAQEIAPAMPPMLDDSAYVGAPLGRAAAPVQARGVYLAVYERPASPDGELTRGTGKSGAGVGSVNAGTAGAVAAARPGAYAPSAAGGADGFASNAPTPAPATASPTLAAPTLVGILAIDAEESALGHDEANLAAAIAGEASLALGRILALEAREREAVLAKNEQMRADLLRSISHDLRTPLTAIAGNADVLLADGEALTRAQRDGLARDIRSDAIWLTSTVENLLAITKLESGGVRLSPTVELMDDIIEEALRHVDPAVSEHELDVEAGPEPVLVSVDARLMVQVVVNLVNNAVAYTPAGSHIRVRTWIEAGRARCAVEDDGPGIPARDRAHIFESFYTVNHGLADGRRSVGLGLSLCSSIVAAHGGTISVSEAAPHGCRFELSLPACRIPEEEDVD